MVPPDSHEIPRVPCYLGTPTMAHAAHVYRGLTCSAGPFQTLRLHHAPTTTRQQPGPSGPTTPRMQHLSALTHTQFGLLRFRSPLLTESQLFSSPTGTEMFHFPAFPPTALYIQARVTPHNWRHFRFPHSDTPGSPLVYQLPGAYRRLPRPSSALGAKASTDRPS